jgi:hypothetical protein
MESKLLDNLQTFGLPNINLNVLNINDESSGKSWRLLTIPSSGKNAVAGCLNCEEERCAVSAYQLTSKPSGAARADIRDIGRLESQYHLSRYASGADACPRRTSTLEVRSIPAPTNALSPTCHSPQQFRRVAGNARYTVAVPKIIVQSDNDDMINVADGELWGSTAVDSWITQKKLVHLPIKTAIEHIAERLHGVSGLRRESPGNHES